MPVFLFPLAGAMIVCACGVPGMEIVDVGAEKIALTCFECGWTVLLARLNGGYEEYVRLACRLEEPYTLRHVASGELLAGHAMGSM